MLALTDGQADRGPQVQTDDPTLPRLDLASILINEIRLDTQSMKAEGTHTQSPLMRITSQLPSNRDELE